MKTPVSAQLQEQFGTPTRRTVLSAAVLTAAGLSLGPGFATEAAAAVQRNVVYTISNRNTSTSTSYPRTEFRGLWTASVLNIDWPSKPGLSIDAQRAELRSLLDLAVKRNLNSVMLQVRPSADRMFRAETGEPWSKYLTGTQGKDPGYDPLAYAISKAHKRGLELHAWINPFRVSMESSLTSLVSSHPARKNPSWSFAYGGRRYYNPGIPAVRNYIRSIVVDLVRRYDIDGIHYDDYFYPYPVAGQSIPDGDAFAQYKGSYTSVASWRRNNINLFVRDSYRDIKAVKRHVELGISPFGIWRNYSSTTLGSATSGLESYSALYADSRRWVKEGWVDYILPQLYWHQGFAAANYNVLVDWWAKQVAGTNVKFYTGEAAYKVGDPATSAWMDPYELRDHLTKGRSVGAVKGQAFYNTTAVRANKLNGIGIMAARHYSRPALPVPMPHLSDIRPYTPTITSCKRVTGGVTLSWTSSSNGEPIRVIAIWRWESTGSVLPYIQSTGTYLRAVRQRTGPSQSWTDTTTVSGKYYWYMIQSISRTGIDSKRATAIFIRA